MAREALTSTFSLTYLALVWRLTGFRYVHVKQRISNVVAYFCYLWQFFIFIFCVYIEIVPYFTELDLHLWMLLHKVSCQIHFFEAVKATLATVFTKIDRYPNHLSNECTRLVLRVDSCIERKVLLTVDFIITLGFRVRYQNSPIRIRPRISTIIVLALAGILVEIINYAVH